MLKLNSYFWALKSSDLLRPPNGEIENGQPVTFSDVIPLAAENSNHLSVVFPSAFANPRSTLFGNSMANSTTAAACQEPLEH